MTLLPFTDEKTTMQEKLTYLSRITHTIYPSTDKEGPDANVVTLTDTGVFPLN